MNYKKELERLIKLYQNHYGLGRPEAIVAIKQDLAELKMMGIFHDLYSKN